MNSNLQNKLSRFEATPPKAIWDKIAGALDVQQTFPDRLYNYKEQPRKDTWQKIEAALSQDAPSKVIPFSTRYKKPLRYIAAAAVLGLVVFSGSLLLKKTESRTTQTVNNTSVPLKQKPAVRKLDQNPPVVTTNEAQAVISAQANPQHSSASTPYQYKRFLGLIAPQNIIRSVVVKGNFVPEDVNKEAMFNATAVNDYMVYSDDDGLAMKLPKKLFSLVNCPDGDYSCKERIHQAQQKLSFASISADFGGVLEMLRQLQ